MFLVKVWTQKDLKTGPRFKTSQVFLKAPYISLMIITLKHVGMKASDPFQRKFARYSPVVELRNSLKYNESIGCFRHTVKVNLPPQYPRCSLGVVNWVFYLQLSTPITYKPTQNTNSHFLGRKPNLLVLSCCIFRELFPFSQTQDVGQRPEF